MKASSMTMGGKKIGREENFMWTGRIGLAGQFNESFWSTIKAEWKGGGRREKKEANLGEPNGSLPRYMMNPNSFLLYFT